MRLQTITLDDNEITINMGYRNDMRLNITLIDQNNVTRQETFVFRVYGEKPTILEIRQESKLLYSASSEYIQEVKQ